MKSPTLLLKTLFVTACLACGVNTYAYDIEYDGFYFNIIGDNEVEVTYKDTNYNSYSEDLVIPSWVRDADNKVYDVVAIGPSAFKDCNNLFYITIPSSVRSITGYPFENCVSLNGVYIFDIKAWCETDFDNTAANNPILLCQRLYLNGQLVTDLIIPEGTTHINSMAFQNCQTITSVTIPSSVTSIGWGAFANCLNMKTLSIGSGMASIDGHAFSNDKELETIICNASTPPALESFGVFSTETYQNASLMVPESSLSAYQEADFWQNFSNISAKTFDFYSDGFYYIIEGDDQVGVTWKGEGNTYSGFVKIPETVTYEGTTYTVTKIEANTFTCCENLTGVTIPATVMSVYYGFFNNQATGLTRIECLAIEPPVGMLDMTADQYASVVVAVPKNSVAAYQADAGWGQFATFGAMSYDLERDNIFYEITGDNEVMVTRKNEYSYAYDYSINIPATITVGNMTYDVTAINEKAFYELNNLTTVTLPSSVKTIGDYAFYKCTNLESVTLSHVDNIGNFSFAYCSSLAEAKFKGDLQSIQGSSFIYCSSIKKFERYAVVDDPSLKYDFVNGVIFTRNAADKTLVAFPCGSNAITYTVPSGTVNIGSHAFRGNTIIKTVNMPTSLREIQSFAFNGCTRIERLEVPKGVTNIGIYAFSECSALADVLLPSTLTFLGGGAFHDDAALTIIKTKATTPPSCGTTGINPNTYTPFDQVHFTSSMLRVPTGYKTIYKAANIWKLFSNIREDDSLLEPEFTLGDVNGDDNVSIADVTALIDYLLSGDASLINLEAADCNQDNDVSIADVTALIDYLLSGSW